MKWRTSMIVGLAPLLFSTMVVALNRRFRHPSYAPTMHACCLSCECPNHGSYLMSRSRCPTLQVPCGGGHWPPAWPLQYQLQSGSRLRSTLRVFGQSTSGQCVDRISGKRECVCDADCVSGSCWGDPHCWTFDGARFTYFGLCQHLLLNTTQSGFPHFQLFAKNKPLNDEKVTVPDELELNISSWGLALRIGENLQVNGVQRDTPYRHSVMADSYKEQFVEVTTKVVVKQIGGVVERVLVYTVVTSFGLIVQKETPVSEHGQMYGVYVHIPRHPHLLGNTGGLLGKWDGDRLNDAVDSYGNQQDLQGSPLAVWLLGDSWCVDPQEVTPMRCNTCSSTHDKRLRDCRRHPVKYRTMTELCSKLRTPVFIACMTSAGVERAVSQCETDLCYALKHAEEAALCNAVEACNQQCGTTVACG